MYLYSYIFTYQLCALVGEWESKEGPKSHHENIFRYFKIQICHSTYFVWHCAPSLTPSFPHGQRVEAYGPLHSREVHVWFSG